MGDRANPLEMERALLRGGLEVVLQTAPASARSFSLSYVAPAGWAFEPPGVGGIAMAAAKLVVGRPGGRRREEVARMLDRYGATLTSSVAPESAEVTLWGPLDAWDPLVELFADAVLHPHFALEELTRVRRQLRERQLRQRVQPDLRAEQELLAGLYGPGHAYGSTGLGTPRSIARIGLADLRRFHRRHYPVRSGQLVVTSGAPRTRILRSLESRFPSTEPSEEPPMPRLPLPDGRPARKDIEISGQSQVAVRIGARAVARSDPEYPALFLLNEVLGGRPLLSRLFQRVRERHGWAYHASSELEAMRWGGYWEAVAGTDPGTRERVVRLMLREIGRLATELIPSGELSRIRESAIGSLPLELETTASAHELAVDVAYHHLPGDFYRTWPSQLRGLSSRQLRAAAETGFTADGALVVTAGPPPG